MNIDKDLITQLQTENEQLKQEIIALQDEITTLQQLPAAKNLLQINTLAAQIVKLSAVQ